MAKENVEYRYLDTEIAECRILEDDNKRFLEGHASVFNQRSKLLFEDGKLFNEIVDPNAFDNVLKDERLDVPMTYNHNRGQLLGRTKSNTLQLTKDDKGLRFRVEIPNTATGNEVYELVKRGDLYENSFGFIVSREDQDWNKAEDGTLIRTIKNVQRLVDVAVCINGAYPNTDVAARSLEEFETEEETIRKAEEAIREAKEKEAEEKRMVEEELNQMKLRLETLKHKNNS
jgi:HK97 family phage prohead protease